MMSRRLIFTTSILATAILFFPSLLFRPGQSNPLRCDSLRGLGDYNPFSLRQPMHWLPLRKSGGNSHNYLV